MSPLSDRARNILEEAKNALRCGYQPTDLTFSIDPNGAVCIIAATDWSLRSILEERGAEEVYRVRTRAGVVRVEGIRGRSAFCEANICSLRVQSVESLDPSPFDPDGLLTNRAVLARASRLLAMQGGTATSRMLKDDATTDKTEGPENSNLRLAWE